MTRPIHILFFSALLFQLFPNSLLSQNTDTLRIFFDIDKHTALLNPSYRKHMEDRLNDEKLDSLHIHAYTDFLASDAYNIKLSEKRARFALQTVNEIRKGNRPLPVRFFFYGEKFSIPNESKEGDAYWRRADILTYYHSPNPPPVPEEKKILPSPVPPKERQHPQFCKPCEEKLLKIIEQSEVNDTIVMQDIQFVPGKHRFLVKSIPILNALKRAMQEYPNLKIEIHGHVCCVHHGEKDGLDIETGEYSLSLNRARAVRDWLINRGIDSSRMTYRGHGGRYPKVFPEYSEEDKQKNRRVEIKIIQK